MSHRDQDDNLLKRTADTIRILAAECVQKAASGHPGMPMGMADAGAVLFAKHLRFDPSDMGWIGRDRFILSAGHGSMLQYALLHLFGCGVSLDDLAAFRQMGSKTPGHPERGVTPGVEVGTGPLGQGIANGVGMAVASKMAGARFAGDGFDPFASRIYILAGDGCMMEGISHEAASLAGHLRLDNLVVVYDSNKITIEGGTDLSFTENVGARFEAYGWRVLDIDGHDRDAVDGALAESKSSDRPTLVICRTHIAFGSPGKQDSHDAHGSPLGKEEIAAVKKRFGFPDEELHVPPEVRVFCEAAVKEKKAARVVWNRQMNDWISADKDRADRLEKFLESRLTSSLLPEILAQAPSKADATRNHSGAVLQVMAKHVPALVGGSADLGPSNKSEIKGSGFITAGDFSGRNIHFGVREHAMAAVANGMAAFGGWRPYVATFLVFADYMRPAIRLSAMMNLPVIYNFSHDSYQVGEDGPTHQPVEHIESLRAIPNLRVMRPADGVETAASWYAALHNEGPTAILTTRQTLPVLKREKPYHVTDLLAGAQTVVRHLDEMATLVATGSEVALAVEAAKILSKSGINLRVVSLLHRKAFLERPEEERDRFIPYGRPVCSLEAGVTNGWAILTGRRGLRIGLDHFGASAPADKLAKSYGFTPDLVAAKIRKWLIALGKLGRLEATIIH